MDAWWRSKEQPAGSAVLPWQWGTTRSHVTPSSAENSSLTALNELGVAPLQPILSCNKTSSALTNKSNSHDGNFLAINVKDIAGSFR